VFGQIKSINGQKLTSQWALNCESVRFSLSKTVIARG